MSGRLVVQAHDGAVLRRLHPARGDTVFDTLVRAGVPIRTTCRGSTICGQCRVEVVAGAEGVSPARPDEQALLDRFAPGSPTTRLACRLTVPDGAELVISTPYWGA